MSQSPTVTTNREPGQLRFYGLGFVFSILLTAVPFGLVMEGGLPREATIWIIFGAAFAQILVHLHYFLHLDVSPKSRTRVLALLLTVLIAILIIGGTAWIMYHLDYNLS